MRARIDAAGRILIPRAMLQELGLTGGNEVEIRAVDGRIEIDVPPTPMHMEMRDGHLVAVPDISVPPLTDQLVRETLEKARNREIG